jgi:hypothetical protein
MTRELGEIRDRIWKNIKERVSAEQSNRQAPVSTANHFNVLLRDGEITFCIHGAEAAEGKQRADLQVNLDPDLAVNLAAWIALLADPEGREFCRVYNEIKKG